MGLFTFLEKVEKPGNDLSVRTVAVYVPTSKTEQARLAALTPAEYAREENARARAWMAENPVSHFAGLLSEEPGAYAEYANGLEMALAFTSMDYASAYKSCHGVRPRWAHFTSLEEAEAALADLYESPEWSDGWEQFDPRAEEEAEARRLEAVRAHEERYMDAAASWGACGW